MYLNVMHFNKALPTTYKPTENKTYHTDIARTVYIFIAEWSLKSS